MIACDEKAKSNKIETKMIPTNFNEKKHPVKDKIPIFYLYFY